MITLVQQWVDASARRFPDKVAVACRDQSISYGALDRATNAFARHLAARGLGRGSFVPIFVPKGINAIKAIRDGTIERGAHVRLIRDNIVVHEGKLGQLKRFKDDAKEVVAGQECGMAFESYQDMRVGDVIECYRVEEIKRSL